METPSPLVINLTAMAHGGSAMGRDDTGRVILSRARRFEYGPSDPNSATLTLNCSRSWNPPLFGSGRAVPTLAVAAAVTCSTLPIVLSSNSRPRWYPIS